jgi:hypothetical protein
MTNRIRGEVSGIGKSIITLTAVVLPLIVMYLIISLNIGDLGTLKWVGQVWISCSYFSYLTSIIKMFCL